MALLGRPHGQALPLVILPHLPLGTIPLAAATSPPSSPGSHHLSPPPLPEGWVSVPHVSGALIYLHRPTRVVTLSRPYHVSTSTTIKVRQDKVESKQGVSQRGRRVHVPGKVGGEAGERGSRDQVCCCLCPSLPTRSSEAPSAGPQHPLLGEVAL